MAEKGAADCGFGCVRFEIKDEGTRVCLLLTGTKF